MTDLSAYPKAVDLQLPAQVFGPSWFPRQRVYSSHKSIRSMASLWPRLAYMNQTVLKS